MQKNYVRRLPFENLYNARDLGGYPCENGKSTKWHQFVRSEDLSKVSKKDIESLKKYGVKTIIDLRGEAEIIKSPNPLKNNDDFNYFNVSLIDEDASNILTFDFSKYGDDILGNLYVDILENKQKEIKKIFNIISENTEGAILYHCTAGKDRTGVLTMLLLGLVHVYKADIVNDYSLTNYYLCQNPHFQKNINLLKDETKPKEFLDKLRHLLSSNHSFIEKPYEYIVANHNTFEEYLVHIGLEEKDINNVKNKLV